ncbi:MAG: TIGR03067 domain-containing protein [Planctomycetota bacterium]
MSVLSKGVAFALTPFLLYGSTAAHALENGLDPEYGRLQGNWQIVELTDNGKSVPPDQITNSLPAGGQFEVVDNTMIFTSPLDGRKTAKTFAVDPTAYPKRIAVVTGEQVEGVGIYEFDKERLIVCMSNPLKSPQPKEFSAREDSNRMMMVLERPSASPNSSQKVQLPPPPRQYSSKPPTPVPPAASAAPSPAPPAQTSPPNSVAARVLTDDEVIGLLIGTWRVNDGQGILDVTFNLDRTFRSFREASDMTTFHQVFLQTPVSSGTWTVQKGQLLMTITASTNWDRVNRTMPFAVRSISAQDAILVDYLGRVMRVVKVR